MATMTLADMAHTFALRRHGSALQTDLQRLSTEVVTGRAADTGRAVGGDFTELSAISGSLSRIRAYEAAGTLAATLASGTQNALTSVDEAIGSLGVSLSDPTLTGNGTSVTTLGEGALGAFRATVSALNTQVSGQSLFAGTGADGPALIGADKILRALEEAASGATTAAEVQSAVDEWFRTDFATTAYQGGEPRAPAAVGENDRLDLSVTALDPALTDTLKGLATGALLARGVLEGQEAERSTLARLSGAALLNADAARNDLTARLGTAEGRLDDIRTRNSSQISAMELARVEILSVDSYETAVRLEATQTQIETLYSVTARLSRMTLAEML